jgi:signal transduction histidine kinase
MAVTVSGANGRRAAALACFCLLAGLVALGSYTYRRTLQSQSRTRVELALSAYGSALAAALGQRLALVYGVMAFVRTDASRDPAHFERFAADLVKSTPGVLHVSLTRDGVIRATWPADMVHLGLDFAHDPRERVRTDYERAMATPRLTIAGPFAEVGTGKHHVQRSLAVVAMHPIPVEGGPANSAVILALDVPQLLHQIGIDPAPASLDLALRDRRGAVFYGDAGVFANGSVVHRIDLPDGAWELAGNPRGGWSTGVSGQVVLLLFAGVFIAALAALVLYLVMQRIAARAQQVQELARHETEVWRKATRIIGHEINNTLAPVSSLIFSAKQLVQRPEAVSRLPGVLDIIGERANHLRTFLDGYSRFARLPPPTKRLVEWKPFFDEIGLLYPFVLTEQLPSAPGVFDPEQVQQVLINLLKNAQESGSAADQVQIEVRAAKEIVISVLDRGPGMKPEALDRAGELFFTTKPGGSGLGLHLCREIARAHGGTFELSARGGGGLIARVSLPSKA